jgi:CheY-like chemotaxis protein
VTSSLFKKNLLFRQLYTKIVITALTAFALTMYREKAKEAGCSDYIAKPVGKDELTGLIQKYFDKKII